MATMANLVVSTFVSEITTRSLLRTNFDFDQLYKITPNF